MGGEQMKDPTNMAFGAGTAAAGGGSAANATVGPNVNVLGASAKLWIEVNAR